MDRIAVIGGGLMGSGIAEVCARSGCDVRILEINDSAAAAALERVSKSLGRAVKSERLTEADSLAAFGRITTTTDIAALADAELIIEAAPEIESLKQDLFARLDKVIGAETILASNTSSIPLAKLAGATTFRDRFVGIHFFNPAPVMPLVEIIPTLLSTPDAVKQVTTFVEDRLGKHTITSPDRAGFVVNALLVPYLLSAVRMFESGLATAEDIDAGMVKGCAHPMGPLTLMDLIGLDTIVGVADSMFNEYKEPLYAPPPLLQRMVQSGLLGRKSGRGFYDYSKK
ncbi:MAG: 3-hydroxybutyryl-CoA dehydrogenase [Frankiales bacterium]|nr:3-hydroxybutyryl-CoA dehydrogenase [Frankiales bacterium]